MDSNNIQNEEIADEMTTIYFQIFDTDDNDIVFETSSSDKESDFSKSTGNIKMFLENLDKQHNSIKYASLNKIIQYMTDIDYLENKPNILQFFFCCYPSFATDEDILRYLIIRYEGPNLDLDYPENMKHKVEKYQQNKEKIQKGVVQAFLTWFEVAPECFRSQSIIRRLSKYVKAREGETQIEELTQGLIKMLESLNLKVDIPERTNTDEDTTVLSFNVTDVAKQMALLDYTLFKLIKPKEYLKQGWSKNGKENSPNIIRFIEWFNSQSCWVSSQILSGKSFEDRAKIIEFMIDVAYKSTLLHNFSFTFAIWGSFNNVAVSRLSKSWKAVSENSMKIYEKLKSFCDQSFNFRNYRNELKKSKNVAVIPFLARYLSDLTGIDDFYQTKTDEGHISFEKVIFTGNTVMELRNWVSTELSIAEDTKVRKFLLDSKVWEEGDIYKVSKLREASNTSKTQGEGEEINLEKEKAAIDESDWDQLFAGGEDVEIVKDMHILKHGSTNTNLYRIKSGAVKVTIPTNNGEKEVGSIEPGIPFGEMSILGENAGKATANIIACETVIVRIVPVEYIFGRLSKDPELSSKFFRFIATNLALKLVSFDEKSTGPKSKELEKIGTLKRQSTKPSDQFFEQKFGSNKLQGNLLKVAKKCKKKSSVAYHDGDMYITDNYINFVTTLFGTEQIASVQLSVMKSCKVNKGVLKISFTKKDSEKVYSFKEGSNNEGLFDFIINLYESKKQVHKNSESIQNKEEIKNNPLFQNKAPKNDSKIKAITLSNDDWQYLLNGARKIKVKKDEHVVTQGTNFKRIYYISSGNFSVEIEKEKKMETIAVMKSGGTFGELSLLLSRNATATVVALEEAELVVLDGYILDILFSYKPELAGKFYNFLANKLSVRIKERQSK
eukprot:TRINITY_DN1894_c0_g1_i3.p1 TRINITY_DN1894_c0_g1~~TRINITY_DN1894_c0_g1_i3.p1  ORF type:complete len:894 (+),score=239.60 TRINITY_DN1894_c0_g1_i3:1-2682(+)